MSERWTKAEQFKNELKRYFEDPGCPKTGWGKNELAAKIEELWSRFLMGHLKEPQTTTTFEPGDGAFDTCVETPNGWRRK